MRSKGKLEPLSRRRFIRQTGAVSGLFFFSKCWAGKKNNQPVNSETAPMLRGLNSMDIGDFKETDITSAKEWGANILGTRFDFQKEMGGIKSQLPVLLASAHHDMKLFRKHGMKCTIGLRGEFWPGMPSKESLAFWSDPQLGPLICDTYKTIAEELLPYRDVIHGYYLLGEALYRDGLPDPPPQWYGLALKIVKAIREVDDRTWIIFQPGPGGVPWGYKNLKPLPDPKIIYDVHYYTPHKFTHQGVGINEYTGITEAMEKIDIPYPMPWEYTWETRGYEQIGYKIPEHLKDFYDKELQLELLRPAIEFQKKYKVPMIVLEFSVARWAPVASAVNYLSEAIEIFEELGWSWLYHGWGGNVWNLQLAEGTENFWKRGMPWPTETVPYETERAKVIKKGLAKNGSE
jgi:hypothetical protein